jgi:hypothetical protein
MVIFAIVPMFCLLSIYQFWYNKRRLLVTLTRIAVGESLTAGQSRNPLALFFIRYSYCQLYHRYFIARVLDSGLWVTAFFSISCNL